MRRTEVIKKHKESTCITRGTIIEVTLRRVIIEEQVNSCNHRVEFVPS